MEIRLMLLFFCVSSKVFCADVKTWKPEEFDFVIVGAGSAGAVVAARLSEIPNVNVLLLEAGDNPPKEIEIPLLASTLWDNPEIDWKLRTESQEQACLSYSNKQSPWTRGKMLGGSSGLNGMIYTRGNRYDYDHWASLGNDGWSYEEVFPYFLKMENYAVPQSKYDAKFHSSEGPLLISQPPYRTPLAAAFLEAGQELGYYQVDYNAEFQKGFMTPVFTIYNGTRFGTYKAYLEPIRSRSNLKIVTKAVVTKILIEDKEAKGVQFEKDGSVWTVKSKKEIVLSAGTPFSPQILMLSGIGPKNILEKFQIPVIMDLPGVGQNLQDHPVINGLSFTLEEPVGINLERDINDDAKKLYEQKRLGVLTVPATIEGISFMDSKYADSKIDYPDYELMFGSSKAFPVGLSKEVFEALCPPDSRDYFTVFPVLQRPVTRGYITLRSADPHVLPIFQPNYLAEDEDVEVLLEAVKATLALVNTTAFQRFGAKYSNDKVPACKVFDGDDYWICFIRQFSIGLFHISGTCKMGPATDTMAVVDPQLRVYGVKGLRVADASIMPTIITGHTNAPSIMIGEKAADMIKKQWNIKHDEL